MSDDLVDAVADEIYRLRFANKNVTSRALARAALAIIEPAVREQCAKVVDDVVAELQANISDNIAEVRVIEIAPEANRRLIFARDWMRHTAAAIRAGAKP